MNSFGFRDQIDLDGSPNNLPCDIYMQLRDKLDTNPPDKDWRALVRAVEDKYYIGSYTVESWSGAINQRSSPADKLLSLLASRGMTVKELAKFLDQISIETYHLGLRAFEEIKITQQPGNSKDVYTGDTLFLEVEATGQPYPRYQWFFCPDGEDDFKPLQGRTERVLRIEGVTKNHAGTYACQLHNCADPAKTKITEMTLVCVNPKLIEEDEKESALSMTKEILVERSTQIEKFRSLGQSHSHHQESFNGHINLIVQHPSDVAVEMNGACLLEVGAMGVPPIQYQWYKDEQMLLGRSTNIIEISHARPEDFGVYYCIVQDGIGLTEQSRKATVKQWPLLAQTENDGAASDQAEIIIISQPKSCMVKFGGDALFHCEAKCNSPLQYKWFKNGKPMEDQRKSEIKFINIQDRLKEGMYQCAVYCGGKVENAMLSAPALLTIEVPRVNENIEYNPSDKVALLIGNYDYRCEESLKAPPNDVRVLSEAFRSLNFKVISLLNLTKAEIESAVLHFCELVHRNVYVVFYFCGHGFEEDGCSFLVPTDARHMYGTNDCVCTDSILQNIQKNSPPLVCLIIDICRKPNRCKGDGLPSYLSERTSKGNTVYCYATSTGLNAFEDSKNGLLVKHLQPLLHKKIGIDLLVSELKEEFSREPKHSNRQIPELKSNIIEPRRSLADKISYLGETELFHKRSKIWRESWIKPEKQLIPFREISVMVELDFQAEFSNVLHVFVIVKNKGITTSCVAFLNNWPAQVSAIGKNSLSDVPCTTKKFSFADIQKLQGDMVVSVVIQYRLRGDQEDRFSCVWLNLGQPLVAKLQLWKSPTGFVPQGREAVEQTEDSESLSSM